MPHFDKKTLNDTELVLLKSLFNTYAVDAHHPNFADFVTLRAKVDAADIIHVLIQKETYSQ